MQRFHDFDALRSFVMLLGILLHACVFLLPIDQWPVQDQYARSTELTRNPYAWLISIIHGFRMPVFFLLSGFFTAMLWESRGIRRLVQHRLKRIGLPLLISAFTIVPVTEWQFDPDTFDALRWPLAWLDGFHHLWFLWYLLMLAGAFTLAVHLPIQFRSLWWWLLVPLGFLPQLLMVQLQMGADNPAQSMLPTPNLLGYYATFFFFGVFFFQRRIVVRAWWTGSLPVALLVVFPVALVLLYPERFLGSPAAWAWPASSLLQIVYTWLMCFGCMGLFRRIASKKRPWIRYVSDASYWMYVVHLPLVVAGQMLMVNLTMNVHLKFTLLCATAIALLLASYQLGVRYTVIGAVLNGPRTRTGVTSAN